MEAEIRDVHVEKYYPSVITDAAEFQQIATVENPEFLKVWENLWRWMLNTFVLDIDEAGATQWETMLKIRSSSTDTLDQRRTVILAKINSVLPYTYRRLQQILDTLCGAGTYQILIDHVKCEFGFRALPGATGIDRICGILRPMIPANLSMFLEIVRQAQMKYYVGVINATIGRKRINLPPVPNTNMAATTGVAYIRAGRHKIGSMIPPESTGSLYTGNIIRRTGRITIGGIK